MPKKAPEKSPVEIKRLAKVPGMHAVGGVAGLYLNVTKNPDSPDKNLRTSWILKKKVGIRRPEMGLGAYPDVPLTDARNKARAYISLIADGVDPVADKREKQSALKKAQGQAIIFAQAVETAAELDDIKDDKAGRAWRYKLKTYALPTLGKIPVSEIERSHITDVLKPIWTAKSRTAKDVRKLIEHVLDRSYAINNIGRHNPARWDKLLKATLPKETKKPTHFPALPFSLMNTFLGMLAKITSREARALEFLIYTGARSGEVRGATWGEVDLGHKLWTIPGDRMKKGEEHRVALSKPALAILNAAPKGAPDAPVFPTETGKHIQDARLSSVARQIANDMKFKATVHGMRATFRTWGEEETEYPSAILEMALAHKIEDAVKASYQRGDLLKKRRALMDDWAAYCAEPSPDGQVVPIRRRKVND
tara:strand:+ start:157 stop:1422 length:1266 start_codon:yes stop_codon:yes gene_type:complete